jgi:hypothetical protein
VAASGRGWRRIDPTILFLFKNLNIDPMSWIWYNLLAVFTQVKRETSYTRHFEID